MARWLSTIMLLVAVMVAGITTSQPAQAQHCVRTVRALSDFTIRGNAWTWWNRAAQYGYSRGHRPEPGSVLVFGRQRRLPTGHVSLVTAIIDQRTIWVHHTWSLGAEIEASAQVVDVSDNNDWSLVRVWHGETETMGVSSLRISGFIYPQDDHPQTLLVEAAASAMGLY
ncbi:MAG: CHAP domain-containing protein [Pseudomonadota bacterium]